MSDEQRAIVLEATARREATRITAARLGVHYRTVQNYRHELGLSGKVGRPPTLALELETMDATPGCVRCGLRGDHECLSGSGADRRAWAL